MTRYFQKCPKCKGKAWQYKQKPKAGDVVLTLGNVIHSGNPKPFEVPTCQLCGYVILNNSFRNRFLIVEN